MDDIPRDAIEALARRAFPDRSQVWVMDGGAWTLRIGPTPEELAMEALEAERRAAEWAAVRAKAAAERQAEREGTLRRARRLLEGQQIRDVRLVFRDEETDPEAMVFVLGDKSEVRIDVTGGGYDENPWLTIAEED